MTVRTTKTTVTFAQPFVLAGHEELLPAGTYEVETDEERLEGLSFHAYRRILTLIHLPTKLGHRGLARTLTIDPEALDAALRREALSGAVPAGQESNRKPSEDLPKTRHVEIDRRAVDRADDEGMAIHPQ